jgi:hypothetical protein
MGKESDLYDPLNTKTIGGDLRLDVATYENVQDNIHLEGVNRKLLELTDLVGRVTNNRSSSGPIPGTVELISETFDSAAYKTYKTPASGEVWQVMGVSVSSTTGLSGTGVVEVDIYNPTTTDRLIMADMSFTSSSDFPIIETSVGGAVFYADENTQIRIRCEGTWTSVNNVTLGIVRVR